MSPNPPLDIEILMERIRKDVALKRKSAAPAPESTPRYVPGTLLRFGQDGNAGPYLGSGWAGPELKLQWTLGEVAELKFLFEKPPGDMVLSFTAHPLIGGGIVAQEVSASWNDIPVGEWNISEAKSFHTLILSHVVEQSPTCLLKFHLPGSFSPLSKHLSSDPRRLGLNFEELVLRSASDLGFQ